MAGKALERKKIKKPLTKIRDLGNINVLGSQFIIGRRQ